MSIKCVTLVMIVSGVISDMSFPLLTKITLLLTISDSVNFQRRTAIGLDVHFASLILSFEMFSVRIGVGVTTT